MPVLILAIDDEAEVREAIVAALQSEEYEVITAADGEEGLELVRTRRPDLVLLDLMLPSINGMDVCARIREYSEVPIIMVTGLSEEDGRVAGLTLGADDYITKPFRSRELRARVEAVLRRSTHWSAGDDAETIEVGDLVVQPAAREVRVAGERIRLTPKEYELLEYLARHADRPVSRAEVLRAVWGEVQFIDARTLDVHIRWLREKIEQDPSNPRRLLTVRGEGYLLVPLQGA